MFIYAVLIVKCCICVMPDIMGPVLPKSSTFDSSIHRPLSQKAL
uniref:Uncharacterized protein n=1 Tax=Anguilla anguilla TaxID=7936 RepID=A0A0E9U8G6_ANGAN